MSTVLKQHYAEMVSSSVDWAGATPSHWEIQRLGRLFRESSQRAISKAELEYPILSVSIHDGISDKEMNEEELDRKVTRSDDRSLYKVVEENDLAYNMMRAWQGGFGAAQVNGLISPAYVVCKPRTSLPSRYFELLLRTPTAVTELKRFSRGITDFRLRLYWDDFKKIEVAVPPEREQNQILAFLDYETAKIDGLIEKQQQLIALLGEKRQAVISHAVTKGLNPDAPMRDSGIEWIGEVPEHWTVVPFKSFVLRFEQGWSPQCDQQMAEPDEWGVLKVGCCNTGTFDRTENKRLPKNLKPRPEYNLKNGDLLISRANTAELCGRAAVIQEDEPFLILCDKLYRVRVDATTSPDFVSHYLTTPAAREQIELGATGASPSMKNIGQDTIKKMKIPRPPLNEAKEIVRDIERNTLAFDAVIAKAEGQVDLLQERRTALISAAVTGKIDVRGWKPPSTAAKQETEMEVA